MPTGEPSRPFTYEQFLAKYDQFLGLFSDDERAFFDQQYDPVDPDRTKRLLYAVAVTMIQYPQMSRHEMLYVITSRMTLDLLALGATVEQIDADLRGYDWRAMPGMSEYSSETANSIARRAFEDAVAGVFRGPIMQGDSAQVPRAGGRAGDDYTFTIDTVRF